MVLSTISIRHHSTHLRATHRAGGLIDWTSNASDPQGRSPVGNCGPKAAPIEKRSISIGLKWWRAFVCQRLGAANCGVLLLPGSWLLAACCDC